MRRHGSAKHEAISPDAQVYANVDKLVDDAEALHSLAKSERNRGDGAEGIPTDVYKELPYMMMLKLICLF